jgi:hypothetical protein
MFNLYLKLEDVPEALREHYKLIEGKYVPEISDDHPLKLNNVKLLNEKTAAETKAGGLESTNTSLKADLESAKAHSLPRGHRAVPVAEVEAMEKLKEHGTATEIATKLTEHTTLKADAAQRAKQDVHKQVAAQLGYNEAAFLQLPNLPDMELREVNGKKSVIVKVKDGESFVEKPASEFVESNYAPLLPALKAKTETTVPTTGGGGGNQTADPFQWARDFGKNWNESKPATDVKAAFGITG